MSDFGFYSANEFLERKFESKEYLVDQILHHKDCVILAGKPKSGKSVLLFQLICSLTSGAPFLDEFEVKKKCKVLYIQLEGSLGDSQDRMRRMMMKIPMERENFSIMFSPPLNLNNPQKIQEFIDHIKEKMPEVDVIIIDPIYFAMAGSLSDDESVRNFTGNLRILQDTFNCAIILAHHFKKARKDKEGFILPTDDDDIFGSVFFQAWITHQFLFDYDKVSKTRTLQCNVQRSGKIMERINLQMIEPEPLYFKIIDNFPTKGICLAKFFRENSNSEFKGPEVQKLIKMEKSTFYRESTKLMNDGLISRRIVEGEYQYKSTNRDMPLKGSLTVS